jgi:hypothetical protein
MNIIDSMSGRISSPEREEMSSIKTDLLRATHREIVWKVTERIHAISEEVGIPMEVHSEQSNAIYDLCTRLRINFRSRFLARVRLSLVDNELSTSNINGDRLLQVQNYHVRFDWKIGSVVDNIMVIVLAESMYDTGNLNVPGHEKEVCSAFIENMGKKILDTNNNLEYGGEQNEVTWLTGQKEQTGYNMLLRGGEKSCMNALHAEGQT